MGHGTCPQVPYSAVGKMRLLHMTPLKSRKVYNEEWNAHNSVKLHGTDTYQEVCEVRKNNKELMVAQVLGKGSWKMCSLCFVLKVRQFVCTEGRENEIFWKRGGKKSKVMREWIWWAESKEARLTRTECVRMLAWQGRLRLGIEGLKIWFGFHRQRRAIRIHRAV